MYILTNRWTHQSSGVLNFKLSHARNDCLLGKIPSPCQWAPNLVTVQIVMVGVVSRQTLDHVTRLVIVNIDIL